MCVCPLPVPVPIDEIRIKSIALFPSQTGARCASAVCVCALCGIDHAHIYGVRSADYTLRECSGRLERKK